MRMSTEPSREEIDRLRGLARAAWARLQRDDLDDEQSASAQEEYARTRDELLDLGIGIEVTEQQSLTFVEEEEIVEDYDPELLIECIDGSMDPVPLRNLTRIVDLAGFLKTPVCAAIGKWATPRVPSQRPIARASPPNPAERRKPVWGGTQKSVRWPLDRVST